MSEVIGNGASVAGKFVSSNSLPDTPAPKNPENLAAHIEQEVQELAMQAVPRPASAPCISLPELNAAYADFKIQRLLQFSDSVVSQVLLREFDAFIDGLGR